MAPPANARPSGNRFVRPRQRVTREVITSIPSRANPRSPASTVAGTSRVRGRNAGRCPSASERITSARGDSSSTSPAGSGTSCNSVPASATSAIGANGLGRNSPRRPKTQAAQASRTPKDRATWMAGWAPPIATAASTVTPSST